MKKRASLALIVAAAAGVILVQAQQRPAGPFTAGASVGRQDRLPGELFGLPPA